MNFILTSIFVPIFGAFGLSILPKRIRPVLSVAILVITFSSVVFSIFALLKTKALSFSWWLNSWLSFSFFGDALAVFMAAVSSFVALLIGFYSLEYMQDYEERNRFYFWMLLFVGAMMGLVFSSNLMLMFCFWEITSVCSWRLIGFYRKEKDLKSADKAFLVTFFGASLMLAGIIMIFLNYGTLNIPALRGLSIVNLSAFLILCGVIAKSAQLPLQTWLPDAGVAPTPVTSLLHAAVLVKIGIYVFARIFCSTVIATTFFFNCVIALSVVTILVASGCAFIENNMKRILAYSTISQLGYIMFCLALNTDFSLKIALLYILAHSLAKAGLFLCAGIIEHKTSTKDINALGGLIKTMPLVALAYILCAFSIIGIPPLLGFWPKFMLVLSAIKQGYILAASMAVLGALFTLFYLMRLFNKVFLGEEKIQVKEEAGSPMVVVVVILGVLSLLLGLVVSLPLNFINLILR